MLFTHSATAIQCSTVTGEDRHVIGYISEFTFLAPKSAFEPSLMRPTVNALNWVILQFFHYIFTSSAYDALLCRIPHFQISARAYQHSQPDRMILFEFI